MDTWAHFIHSFPMGSIGDSSTKADAVLVLVHGIGAQLRGATLVEWAEPLARRLNMVARQAGGQAHVTRSVLGNHAPAEVHVEVQRPHYPVRRIVITEARWAEAFITEGTTPVFWWAVRFSFRAAWRAASHFIRFGLAIQASVVAASTSFSIAQKVRTLAAGLAGATLKIPLTVAILMLLPVILAAVVLGLGILTVLSHIPLIAPRINPLIQALTSSIGDASTWTSRPVNAAAIRDVVRDEIRRANGIGREVIVLGHSQGAAVSVEAILAPDADPTLRVNKLITVGGAVLLLRSPRWSGPDGRRDFSPIEAWSAREDLHWINIWAMWDPVSSGPITENPKDGRHRWAECYGRSIEQRLHEATKKRAEDAIRKRTPKLSFMDVMCRKRPLIQGGDFPLPWERLALFAECVGPEEWPVHNRSSLIRDHTSYATNILQVIDPLAYQLLGEPRPYDAIPNGESIFAKGDGELHQDLVRSLGYMKATALLYSIVHAPLLTSSLFDRSWLDPFGEAVRAINEGAGAFFVWVFRAGFAQTLQFILAAGLIFLVVSLVGTLIWRCAHHLKSWRPFPPHRNRVAFNACHMLLYLLNAVLVALSLHELAWRYFAALPSDLFTVLTLVFGMLPFFALLPLSGARPAPIQARRASNSDG